MKDSARCLLIALSFFLLALAACPAAGQSPLSEETLPNGLRVLSLENPGTISVSVDLWIKAGSRHETAAINGISHFLEHLLFKGTSRRSAKEIARQIAAVGGSLNAYTHWEYTQIHLSLLPRHLPLAFDILADIVQNSVISEEMVARERKVVLEEISLGNIFPPSYVLNLVSRTLFPDSSLRLPIAGTKESVSAISREKLRQYYQRHYVAGNALLTVVGRAAPAEVQALAREKLGAWPRGGPAGPPLAPPERQSEFRQVQERKFLDQAIVVVALQAVGLNHPDRPAFEVVNAVLGSGGHSRLYQEIREKRGLSYLVGSLYHPLADTGLWATYAGTAPKNLEQVRAIIYQEIRRIREEPLAPQELEEIKHYLGGRLLIRTENNSALADFIGQGLRQDAPELPADFLQKIQAVTARDVQRVAQTYLRSDQCNLIVLKPYPGLVFFRGLL